jgi:hypothetical protein
MTRIHSDPNPSAAALSGSLRDVLVQHTKERMRHFFLFIYTYRLLMHVLDVPAKDWANYVSIKATHQIDSGLRRENGWDVSFKNDDVSVLDLYASGFKRVDASHFCNLGLKPALSALCAATHDQRVLSLYGGLVNVRQYTPFAAAD